jgi:uncharacterized protein
MHDRSSHETPGDHLRRRYSTGEEHIQGMVERIVKDFDPLQIVLFGSHARQEATQDSDVDILVVLSEAEDKRRSAIEIRRSLRGFPISKDIVVTDAAEIARRGDLVGTILRPALREGVVVYERQRS